MPFTLTMPKLSPTMEEGTIAKWRKKEGDFVKAGDVLIEVATDKATVEHSALDEGWLRKILINEGQSAHADAQSDQPAPTGIKDIHSPFLYRTRDPCR